MRRILTAACAVLLCAGCSSGSDGTMTNSAGSCAARITWDGTIYYGQEFDSLPPSTLTLGIGGRPTCSDTNGGEAGASSTVEVRRLPGVDPRIAVAVRGESEVGYLAAGYFVQLPSHPLHDAIKWPARSLNELIGCRRSPPMRVGGRIRYGPSPVIDVSSRDGLARRYVGPEMLLSVDAHTRIEELSRDGLPYVPVGREVSVEAVACLDRDGKPRKLVPRRIAPA